MWQVNFMSANFPLRICNICTLQCHIVCAISNNRKLHGYDANRNCLLHTNCSTQYASYINWNNGRSGQTNEAEIATTGWCCLVHKRAVRTVPDSNINGANVGPTWGRMLAHTNIAIWGVSPCAVTVTLHERHGVSNHRQLDCIFNRLFRLKQWRYQRSALVARCEENPLVTYVQ